MSKTRCVVYILLSNYPAIYIYFRIYHVLNVSFLPIHGIENQHVFPSSTGFIIDEELCFEQENLKYISMLNPHPTRTSEFQK